MKAAALAGALAIATATPALAQLPEPPAGAITGRLDASPPRTFPGGVVAAIGKGCGPNAAVRLDLYNPALRGTLRSRALPNGDFVEPIEIPPGLSTGRAWLRASCQDEQGRQKVLDATLVVSRPSLVVTWVNVLFGVGAFLIVFGFGILMRRPSRRPVAGMPKHKRRKRSRGFSAR